MFFARNLQLVANYRDIMIKNKFTKINPGKDKKMYFKPDKNKYIYT